MKRTEVETMGDIDRLLEKIEKLEEENRELRKSQEWLYALEEAGVDNWDGLCMAHEIYSSE